MPKESLGQQKTIKRVMHEFKHGKLESHGRKVENPKQAIAIGLSEAGASKYKSRASNQRSLARTKQKERTGQTAKQVAEGTRQDA